MYTEQLNINQQRWRAKNREKYNAMQNVYAKKYNEKNKEKMKLQRIFRQEAKIFRHILL